jgi:F-type H+-transporting ATPase subunit a
MLNTLVTLAAGADPAAHALNHKGVEMNGWWVWTAHQGNLVIAGLILIIGGLWVASRIRTGPESMGSDRYITRGRLPHMIEVICVYLRDEIARPLLHDRTDKLMPFLWTLFFFILVNNLLGLVPLLDLQHLVSKDMKAGHLAFFGGTATQNLWITGLLALISAIFFNIAALKRLGVKGYLGHLTGGAPFPVSILLFVLEGAGQIIIKPVALAIRLFANMTAGHILLATLFMFAGQALFRSDGSFNNPAIGLPVALISALGGLAVLFLELFVAFLQAFIFMFLTTVFISLMDHHDEHGHDHEHAHAHGHEHAHAHA